MNKNKLVSVAAWIMIVFAGFSLLTIVIGQLLPEQPPEWLKGIIGEVPEDTSGLPVAPLTFLVITGALNLIEIGIATKLLKNAQKIWLGAIIFVLIQPVLRHFLGVWLADYGLDFTNSVVISMIIPVILSILIYLGIKKK